MRIIDRSVLLDAAYEAEIMEDDLRLDYSGRGMYGDKCVGIVVEDPSALIEFVLALADSGTDTSWLRNVRMDSMGMSTIYYWPSVSVKEDD
jgi:hypothetical protein